MNDTHVSTLSALGRAVLLWREGKRIPMMLAAELMEQGYDVPTLERGHRR